VEPFWQFILAIFFGLPSRAGAATVGLSAVNLFA